MTPTANLGYQSFYQAQLTAGISDTDLTIPLDVVPTPSEGFLVLESTSASKREIIYYTSKTSTSVVCPAGGRGYDGTTAQSHLQNSAVIMAPVAAMFSSMRDLFETTPQGWTPVTQSVSSVVYNGNRSYGLTMSSSILSTLSIGMRVRTTRTVAAPTQCTDLESGSSQYWSKTSPTGLTFTTTFTCMAWVKLESYGSEMGIIARRNVDTEGWSMSIASDGRVSCSGLRIASNNKNIVSYQSIPLNKWVHVAATLDMSAGDTSAQKIWIDGVEVPRQYTLTGTATALVQGTTALVVGARKSAGTDPFDGKIAQAAVFSSQLSDATVKSYISQGLSGTETNLVSAYSFNGVATDLNTTNANNLTAQGSAVATNADSPFTLNSFGAASGTLDFGIVTGITSATDITVQVPEGCAIPTSGGVTEMHYSTQKVPYNFPDNTRFALHVYSSTTANALVAAGINVPVDNIRYVAHTGSAALNPAMYLSQVGSVATLTGTTANCGALGAGAATNLTVNFPLTFVRVNNATISTINPTIDNRVLAYASSVGTTSTNIAYANASAVANVTAGASFIIVGSV